MSEEETTWVEREVPEHLEDAANVLITILLKSHGYGWNGAKIKPLPEWLRINEEKQDGA